MDAKDVLKLVATGVTGCFSGGAFLINWSVSPARMTLDTASCRKHWLEDFNRAKITQAGMATIATSAGGLVYYLDKDSDNRVLWLVGSGLIFCVWPWTLAAMMPDIKKLLKDDVIETAGETWVREHISKWNKLHAVRTVLSCTAFSVFLYALLKD